MTGSTFRGDGRYDGTGADGARDGSKNGAMVPTGRRGRLARGMLETTRKPQRREFGLMADWRSAAREAGVTVRDLSPAVGVELGGIDLSQRLSDGMITLLRAACAERTVI